MLITEVHPRFNLSVPLIANYMPLTNILLLLVGGRFTWIVQLQLRGTWILDPGCFTGRGLVQMQPYYYFNWTSPWLILNVELSILNVRCSIYKDKLCKFIFPFQPSCLGFAGRVLSQIPSCHYPHSIWLRFHSSLA